MKSFERFFTAICLIAASAVTALAQAPIVLQSHNYPESYIRHSNFFGVFRRQSAIVSVGAPFRSFCLAAYPPINMHCVQQPTNVGSSVVSSLCAIDCRSSLVRNEGDQFIPKLCFADLFSGFSSSA